MRSAFSLHLFVTFLYGMYFKIDEYNKEKSNIFFIPHIKSIYFSIIACLYSKKLYIEGIYVISLFENRLTDTT